MNQLPLTTNHEYNNPIRIYNQFLKQRKLKQADNFKNLRSYFAYLQFSEKKSQVTKILSQAIRKKESRRLNTLYLFLKKIGLTMKFLDNYPWAEVIPL